jgi:hypothetical protein
MWSLLRSVDYFFYIEDLRTQIRYRAQNQELGSEKVFLTLNELIDFRWIFQPQVSMPLNIIILLF